MARHVLVLLLAFSMGTCFFYIAEETISISLIISPLIFSVSFLTHSQISRGYMKK